jgi:hypothetical protein
MIMSEADDSHQARIDMMADLLIADEDEDAAFDRACLMVEASLVFLAMRYGSRYAAMQAYRQADFWAVQPNGEEKNE